MNQKIVIAINGYGRIGRCVTRALYESDFYSDRIRLAAINEVADPQTVCHLTKYDSTHGRFSIPLECGPSELVIKQDRIRIYQETNIVNLPWKDLGIDAVLDCTGVFSDRQAAELHLLSGAGKVIFSQPGSDTMDATIVYGVIIKPFHLLIPLFQIQSSPQNA